jgi:cytochrome P450
LSDLPSFPQERDPGCPLDLPHAYSRLAEKPVTRVINIGTGEPAWAVTSYDAYKRVNTDLATFSSETTRPGYPGVSKSIARVSEGFMTKSDPPRHTALRRAVAHEFSVRQSKTLRPTVVAIAERLLRDLADAGPPADLYGDFALKLPNFVICQVLGVHEDDHARMHRLVADFMGYSPGQTESSRLTVEAELTDFVSDLIESKRQAPDDDLASRLLANEADGLTDWDRRKVITELITGGFDSTAGAIALGVLLLMQHPDQMEELRADRTLMTNATEEIVRYAGISETGRRRTATADTTLAGCPISAGDGVIAAEIIANRDPSVFESPDRFDIHRSNARLHVGFGWGPHLCLGAPLARVQIDVAINLILDAFPSLTLEVPLDEIEFKKLSVFYGPNRLPVRW